MGLQSVATVVAWMVTLPLRERVVLNGLGDGTSFVHFVQHGRHDSSQLAIHSPLHLLHELLVAQVN